MKQLQVLTRTRSLIPAVHSFLLRVIAALKGEGAYIIVTNRSGSQSCYGTVTRGLIGQRWRGSGAPNILKLGADREGIKPMLIRIRTANFGMDSNIEIIGPITKSRSSRRASAHAWLPRDAGESHQSPYYCRNTRSHHHGRWRCRKPHLPPDNSPYDTGQRTSTRRAGRHTIPPLEHAAY
jgi:hypothetical protein